MILDRNTIYQFEIPISSNSDPFFNKGSRGAAVEKQSPLMAMIRRVQSKLPKQLALWGIMLMITGSNRLNQHNPG